MLRQKGLELSRIQEKNVRIRKIANDLKLNEEIIEPSLDSDEQPERLLTVTDEEITIEKYISPEERKRLQAVAQEEEERKLREMVCELLVWHSYLVFIYRATIGGKEVWT